MFSIIWGYIKYYYEVFKKWSFDKKAVFIASLACSVSFFLVYVGRLAI